MREEAAQANIAKWEMRERENRSGDEDSSFDGRNPFRERGISAAYLCPPSIQRRSAVEGVLMLALSLRSIVKHNSLAASSWIVSASLATWQNAIARWVLIFGRIGQIFRVILGVVRHSSLSASLKAMCIWVLEAVM